MLTMNIGCLGWWTPLTPFLGVHAIIHSDEWAAYTRISRDIPHVQYAKENHAIEFVNRTNGVTCTPRI